MWKSQPHTAKVGQREQRTLPEVYPSASSSHARHMHQFGFHVFATYRKRIEITRERHDQLPTTDAAPS